MIARQNFILGYRPLNVIIRHGDLLLLLMVSLAIRPKRDPYLTMRTACYESKTKLFVTSEVPIHQAFSDDSHNDQTVSDQVRSVANDLVGPSILSIA